VSSHKDVINKAKEIQSLIYDTDTYIQYKKTYELVKKNEQINLVIHTITNLQKEVVTLKHLEKNEAVRVKDKELQLLKDELLSIPLYQEYINYQTELDSLIQTITTQIHQSINAHL
jgi:cell fate (sporulation/competence/biofilm development) regulator YmcA (YheA/YmcA/DUF963 family)